MCYKIIKKFFNIFLKQVPIFKFYGFNFFYSKYYYINILKFILELELYLYYFYKFNFFQNKFFIINNNSIIINLKFLIKNYINNLNFLYYKLINYKKFKNFKYIFIFYNFFILKYPYKSKLYLTDLIKKNLKYNKSLKNLFNIIYFNILNEFNNIKYKLIFKGIKLKISGRINKSEKSFSEVFIKGNFKLYNLNLPIQMFKTYLNTKYGVIGFKIWLIYLIKVKNV